MGGVLTEQTISFPRFFLNLGRKFTVSLPEARNGFDCSEFFAVQRRCFAGPIIFKNLIGLSAKSWPGPGGSNDFVPAPTILVKEHDLYIDGSEFWRRLRQFYLPVFILSFEYLYRKKILHDNEILVYITSRPLGSIFIRASPVTGE